MAGKGLGIGKMWVPPEKVWWPPVLLIFCLPVAIRITRYPIIQNISFVIKAAQTNFI